MSVFVVDATVVALVMHPGALTPVLQPLLPDEITVATR